MRRRHKTRLRIFPEDIEAILRDPQAGPSAYRCQDADAAAALLREMAARR